MYAHKDALSALKESVKIVSRQVKENASDDLGLILYAPEGVAILSRFFKDKYIGNKYSTILT